MPGEVEVNGLLQGAILSFSGFKLQPILPPNPLRFRFKTRSEPFRGRDYWVQTIKQSNNQTNKQMVQMHLHLHLHLHVQDFGVLLWVKNLNL